MRRDNAPRPSVPQDTGNHPYAVLPNTETMTAASSMAEHQVDTVLENVRNHVSTLLQRHQYRYVGRLAGVMWLLRMMRNQPNDKMDLSSEHFFRGSSPIPRGMVEPAMAVLAAELGCEGLSRVAGRTCLTHPRSLMDLVDVLSLAGVDRLSATQRSTVFDLTQRLVVEAINQRARVGDSVLISDDIQTPTSKIADLLARCRPYPAERAHYLVGAILTLTCSNRIRPMVRNIRAHDDRDHLLGDYHIGNDSVYEVSVSPTQGHIAKLERAYRRGLRPYFVVPSAKLARAQALASEAVTCQALEVFVAYRLDVLAERYCGGTAQALRMVINRFNALASLHHPQLLALQIPVDPGGQARLLTSRQE